MSKHKCIRPTAFHVVFDFLGISEYFSCVTNSVNLSGGLVILLGLPPYFSTVSGVVLVLRVTAFSTDGTFILVPVDGNRISLDLKLETSVVA